MSAYMLLPLYSQTRDKGLHQGRAFAEGAREAGHEVEILQVGKMKINGCLGCEYCHTKGEGKCVQKDDMDKVIPAYMDSDMLAYMGIEDAGVCALAGEECKSEEKLAEIRAWAKSL